MDYFEQVRLLANDAIRRDPEFPMAWLELDLTYNPEDQARLPILDKVIELGDRAQGLSPLSKLGVEFARQSRHGDEAAVARVLESWGALPLEGLDLLYVKTRLAREAFIRGQPDAGFPLLEWVAEKWPQDAAAFKQLLDEYLSDEEPPALALAVRHGKQAVALAPEDVAARANLAQALLLAGDAAAARAHVAILAAADPEDKQGASTSEQSNRLFELHLALGDIQEASADARRLMAGSPLQRAQGRAALAAVDLARGAFDDGLAEMAAAAEEYERLHMDSLALHAHWEHARAAYALGRYAEVVAVARRIRRGNADARRTLGGLSARRILTLETVARMDAGWLPTNPTNIGALRQQVGSILGGPVPRDIDMLIHLRLRDWAGVVSAYRDLQGRVTILGIVYPAAHALEQLGQKEEAMRLYERLATHPNAWYHPYRRGQAWLRLGILREKRGDLAGARQAYESLLRLWDLAPRAQPEIREAEQRLKALGAGS
jgi:tetratricopeptide (TPR) repeat protein